MLGLGAFVSTTMATIYVLGDRIDSFYHEDDEFERRETIRRTTRLPVEQTIAELGEGRGMRPFHIEICQETFVYMTALTQSLGIRPPGYEERRRERLKETYGLEINPVSATTEGSL